MRGRYKNVIEWNVLEIWSNERRKGNSHPGFSLTVGSLFESCPVSEKMTFESRSINREKREREEGGERKKEQWILVRNGNFFQDNFGSGLNLEDWIQKTKRRRNKK